MNPYKNILSLDPGGTTGCAVRYSDGKFSTFTCKTPEELFKFIKDVSHCLEQVVIEDFKAELISKWGIYTVQLVGGVRALCYVYNIPVLVHRPQDRYPFRMESKLLLKSAQHVIHEEDALSHLLRWEHDNDIG